MSGNSLHSTIPGRDEWQAELTLRFARWEGGTVLVERRQRGPLTVQKALYPEGPDICHAVIIHPPGGIAGGDRLSIGIEVEKNSCAVITTPAATKWYKAAGRSSRQEIIIRLGEGSALDWLPQENLFFNAPVSIGFQTRSCPYRIGDRVGHGAAWQTSVR